ncbi:Argonaute-2 [Ladona fulva]|uniref:Argonaute-2 n=1 Tax=Ladona fulva TaxID=123851 RepID=A0A8K0KAA5_LADFU|nr:Argonaute-2 [Ladona fulva]
MGKNRRGRKGGGVSEEVKVSGQGGVGQSQGATHIQGASVAESGGGRGNHGRGVRGRRPRGGFGEGLGLPTRGKGDGGIELGEDVVQQSSWGRGSPFGSSLSDEPPIPGGGQAFSKSPSPNQQPSWPPKRQNTSSANLLPEKAPIASTSQPIISSEVSTEKLSAIEKLSLKHKSASLTPPIRKSEGETGRKIEVETNHLPFSIKVKEIIHYDVSIEPDKPKRLMRFVMEAFRQKFYRNRYPAFDGKKNLYSSGFLEFKESVSGEVTVRDDERQMDLEFKVTIKFAARIDTTVLGTYMRMGSSTDIPQRAIQAIDVVLRSAPALRFTPVGRSYFTPPQCQILNLGEGMELWYGFYQSAILGWKPFINVDVAHKGFPKKQKCLDVLKELCGRMDNLDRRDQIRIEKYLKGLKVEYEIPSFPNSKRTYKVNGLRQPANKESFMHEGKKMTIEQYYAQVKKYRLQYPLLPCLHLGSPQRTMYMPMELCTVASGQVVMRKLTEMQTRKMIKEAATAAHVRKEKIMTTLHKVGFGANPTLKEFGIDIGGSFERVPARILEPPQLSHIRGEVTKGVWKTLKFVDGKDLNNWVILNLDSWIGRGKLDGFASLMMSNGGPLGMKIALPRIESADIRSNWTECLNPQLFGNPELMVVIFPAQTKGIYEKVKQTAELRYGILTQCIKGETIKKMNPATASNILLKINAKLNGVNHMLQNRKISIGVSFFERPCMIVGADVTHPSPDATNIPSVAAVVASLDIHAFRYAMEYRLQPPRVEIIKDLENIMKNHLINYYKKNGQAKPERIIMFRDGVSDGQFAEVLNEELMAMRRACISLQSDYKPKITFLVVQKRHHTRFFPSPDIADGRNGNVPAGTIVDTKITHPTELDFYLVSHAGIQGTSRPTKYHLLWDDSDFSTDELEALTYHLCHMFSRCTRSVSYPAPTYYAHLGAFRARAYIGDRYVHLQLALKRFCLLK